MHGGIIKFHSLSYTDGSSAQHYHLLPVRYQGLVFFLIGGIKIRNIAFKFRSTGIYHLIYRKYSLLLSEGKDLFFRAVPEHCSLFIRKPCPLCSKQLILITL